jgi:hypothetical protein
MKANTVVCVTSCPQVRKLLLGVLVVLALILGPMGCSTSNRSSAAGGIHSTNPHYAALELNEGKKWVVAKPMMAHLRNLEKEVQDFEKTPGADDAVLAKQIEENLGRLVTNCTMEGKAHDELHKWLMPFLGMSAEYSKATNPVVQREKRQEIKEALQVFNLYFE